MQVVSPWPFSHQNPACSCCRATGRSGATAARPVGTLEPCARMSNLVSCHGLQPGELGPFFRPIPWRLSRFSWQERPLGRQRSGAAKQNSLDSLLVVQASRRLFPAGGTPAPQESRLVVLTRHRGCGSRRGDPLHDSVPPDGVRGFHCQNCLPYNPLRQAAAGREAEPLFFLVSRGTAWRPRIQGRGEVIRRRALPPGIARKARFLLS
jgi:hypothetical protein